MRAKWEHNSVMEVLIWLILVFVFSACANSNSTKSIDFDLTVGICPSARKPVRCEERRPNFLQCNGMQPLTAWNVSLTSQITNTTFSHFTTHNALLTYNNLTSRATVTEQGVCVFSKKTKSRHKKKKIKLCYFVPYSFTGTGVRYNVVHRSNSQHRPCRCICAFNSVPEDVAVELKTQPHKVVKQRNADNNENVIPEPNVIFGILREPPGSSMTKLVLQFTTNATYRYNIRLLDGATVNCCKEGARPRLITGRTVDVILTENGGKLVKTYFDNLQSGNYCVRLSPEKYSRLTNWCLNYSIHPQPAAITNTLPPPIEIGENIINKEHILHPILGVAVAGLVLGFSIVAWYRHRQKRDAPSNPVPIEDAKPMKANQIKKRIFIIYSHDCDQFVEVIQNLSTFLETNYYCTVTYAKRDTDKLAESQQIWIQKNLKSDIILVVHSEGAYLRYEAWLNGLCLGPRDEIANYETCVFEPLMETLTQNVEISFDYKRVYVISFRFTDTSSKCRLENIVPNRHHTLPKDLIELCGALKLLKIPNEVLGTKDDVADQDLLNAIDRCDIYLKANPRVVANSFVPVASTTLQRPDSLVTSDIYNVGSADFITFSPTPSNCTDLSETYPLAACV